MSEGVECLDISSGERVVSILGLEIRGYFVAAAAVGLRFVNSL